MTLSSQVRWDDKPGLRGVIPMDPMILTVLSRIEQWEAANASARTVSTADPLLTPERRMARESWHDGWDAALGQLRADLLAVSR
jgi:hypothetical protein